MSSAGTPTEPRVASLPSGVLTVDADGIILYANDTIADAVGRSIDQLIGEPMDVLLPSPSRIFFSTHVFPLLRVQRVAEEIYLPIVAADGSELPMLLNGRARETEAGFVADLVLAPMRQRNALESELISARNAAQEASAAKDRFLSIVSHELRSPLAGIIGYADLLLRGRKAELTESQRSYVERIRGAAEYQATLIEDILDFAAVGGSRDLATTVVALEDILARVEDVLLLQAQKAGRTLVRRPRPAPGSVRADARAVQQILLNLGTNALKYGAEGSPIQIVSELQGDRVRISVIDAGDGIPADLLERIFEPFIRLAPGADRGGPRGIGLGLAISRDLARAMGGDITVTSIVGEGSTFVLELPGH